MLVVDLTWSGLMRCLVGILGLFGLLAIIRQDYPPSTALDGTQGGECAPLSSRTYGVFTEEGMAWLMQP